MNMNKGIDLVENNFVGNNAVLEERELVEKLNGMRPFSIAKVLACNLENIQELIDYFLKNNKLPLSIDQKDWIIFEGKRLFHLNYANNFQHNTLTTVRDIVNILTGSKFTLKEIIRISEINGKEILN